MSHYRLSFIGFGNVARALVRLFERKRNLLKEQYDVTCSVTGIATGTYDAKLKDVSGRACLVRNVKVEAGEIFSIEEKELTSCTR